MITKKQLTEYLQEKGIYNDIDSYLVDEFVSYLKLSKQAREDISKKGAVFNIARDETKPYYQQNPSVSILNNATKNLLNISRKLGLSPLDRSNLKLDDDLEDDGFDD